MIDGIVAAKKVLAYLKFSLVVHNEYYVAAGHKSQSAYMQTKKHK